MPERLAVWLYGVHVADIEEDGGRLSLTYTDDALVRFDAGTPLLSLRLPLVAQRFDHQVVRVFLDGLLPEDDQRRIVAQELRLLADNTFGLIQALGRDCAGAIVIAPEDEPPPPTATTLAAAPLDDAALEHLVANLRTAPLGVGDRVRLSLAGVQEKLLLTRLPDGRWGQPVDGTPSTHILKPALRGFDSSVENEMFCMRLAGHLGFAVARVETITVAGRPILAVERYDRHVHSDGTVERIHQEDMCQALGYPPTRKYEDNNGPALRQIARLLRDAAGRDAVESLFRATVLNLIIGNGDAHAKNFSLLYTPTGSVRLAPLYDVMSSRVDGFPKFAMKIDGEDRMDRITPEHLLDEAGAWGIARISAIALLADIAQRTASAAEAASAEVVGVPDGLRPLIDAQLAIFGADLT